MVIANSAYDALEVMCEELPRCLETKSMSYFIEYKQYNKKYYIFFIDEDGIDYEVWSGSFTSRDDEDSARDAIRDFLDPEWDFFNGDTK